MSKSHIKQITFTSRGVRIGHLDTGIRTTHPAMINKVATFQYFDYHGKPTDNRSPFDSMGHGSRTASVMCAREVNGQSIGIAPDAKLCSAVVIDGGQILARIIRGMEWLLDQNVRVVCIPLGIPGPQPVFREMIKIMRALRGSCRLLQSVIPAPGYFIRLVIIRKYFPWAL